jgi:hypothetical protein
MSYKKKTLPVLNIFGILCCLVYAIILFTEKDGVRAWVTEHNAEDLVQTMKATKPWIEKTREFGGLLILIFVLGLNLLKAPRINQGDPLS